LRLALRKSQVETGDIVLLFADESEALTHPYLARAWARRGADLRVPAPGQSKKIAMMGALDHAARRLIVRTSRPSAGLAGLLSACASSPLPPLAAGEGAMATSEATEGGRRGKSDGERAAEHWGKAYAKNPRNPAAALNYARKLEALGDKQQAFAVLQQAASLNAGHRGLLSEYARLALELDPVERAQKLLEEADDPASPDWRVISARGTVFAKQGKYREAIPLYQRALALAPNQASVLNNLALALAMDGNAEQAETLLQQAVAQAATRCG
jgi:Flp pilus assembly protein TadD